MSPCDCGSENAQWHGDTRGLRTYCCLECLMEMTPKSLQAEIVASDLTHGKSTYYGRVVIELPTGDRYKLVFPDNSTDAEVLAEPLKNWVKAR